MIYSPSPTWTRILRNAAESDGFTETEREYAENFLTCAVGEQVKLHALITGYEGVPTDGTLQSLGMEFWYAVNADDVQKATEIHHAIVERAEKLAPSAAWIRGKVQQ